MEIATRIGTANITRVNIVLATTIIVTINSTKIIVIITSIVTTSVDYRLLGCILLSYQDTASILAGSRGSLRPLPKSNWRRKLNPCGCV